MAETMIEPSPRLPAMQCFPAMGFGFQVNSGGKFPQTMIWSFTSYRGVLICCGSGSLWHKMRWYCQPMTVTNVTQWYQRGVVGTGNREQWQQWEWQQWVMKWVEGMMRGSDDSFDFLSVLGKDSEGWIEIVFFPQNNKVVWRRQPRGSIDLTKTMDLDFSLIQK